MMHVVQGWMHHLARHAVACFLTRGDLYCPWTAGRDVFDRLLIDDDWSINNANWMWLSASAFFYQYHRVYSPVTFGKKYDPNGDFVRKFVPELKVYCAHVTYLDNIDIWMRLMALLVELDVDHQHIVCRHII